MIKNDTKVLFGELLLDKKIVTALTKMGFEEPSPIQKETIPLVLEGNDVIGQAQTGTGKTAAFGIPIVQNIQELKHIEALIMSPTRELAIQVSEEISKIGRTKRIKALPIYGGQPIDRQIRALKSGVQVVIGTPGRLLDHIRRGTIKLDHVKYLVLDEADEMLDMGFVDDMEEIIKNISKDRQTLLFSATMPRPILSLTKKYMRAPKLVAIKKEEITAPLIDQYYYETRDKIDGVSRLLDVEIDGKIIIFCRTKKGVDELVISLNNRGYLSEGLHGDLSQNQRDRVMKKFKSGRCDILIATDVAARGLDIENITHVINFDIPQDPESYVHRIGRTGRAGKTGVAMTFITPREFRQLKLIERTTKTKIQRSQLPTDASVIERQREAIISKMQGVLDQNTYSNYMLIVDNLLKDYEANDIAAAALKLMQEGNKALEAPKEYNDRDRNRDYDKSRNKSSDRDSRDRKQKRNLNMKNTGAKKGMVRLFMNVGRIQKITAQDIVQSIAIEAGISSKAIGVVNVYDKFTFVEVPENDAEKVLNSMHKNTVKGIKVNVEAAKAR
jgi:ATP-dependent RNA helicase DeaD